MKKVQLGEDSKWIIEQDLKEFPDGEIFLRDTFHRQNYIFNRDEALKLADTIMDWQILDTPHISNCCSAQMSNGRCMDCKEMAEEVTG